MNPSWIRTWVKDRSADLLISLSLLLLALYVHGEARHFSELGAMFPRAVALAIAVLGLVLLVQSVWSPRAPSFRRDGEAATSDDPRTFPSLAVIGGLILWVALMPRIGFIISSAIGLLAFSLAILGRNQWTGRRLLTLVAFSAIVPVLLHFIMNEYLLVPLP